MKQQLTVLLPLILSLYGCGKSGNIAGKVDETDTSIPGLISPAGEPVAGAVVKIFKPLDGSGRAVDSAVTDEHGEYSFTKVPAGTYSVWAETDSSVFFADSIELGAGVVQNRTDTLKAPRKIVIPVKVEPQHNPQIIIAQILGTDIYPVVDKNSYLTLEKVPDGIFPIRLSPSNPALYEYTPRSWDVVIDQNSPDTLTDTLDMTYTGVPVVQNISAEMNVFGDVSLTWEHTQFQLFAKYLIFRDRTDAVTLSTIPIGSSPYPGYTDTPDTQNLPSGSYVYRVKILSQDERVGISFYCDTVEYTNKDELSQIFSDSAVTGYLHEKTLLKANISPYFGTEYQISCSFDGQTSVLTAQEYEQAGGIPVTVDTLYDQRIPAVVTVQSKKAVITDTAYITAAVKWSKISAVPAKGTILSPLTAGTSIYLPILNGSKYQIFRSDDAGSTWAKISDSAVVGDTASQPSNPVFWNGRFWIVDGRGLLHSSADGAQWASESSTAADPVWQGSVETKFLAVSSRGLELCIDNTAGRTAGGTELTFWLYNQSEKRFDPAGSKNSVREYITNYWLTAEENGFSLFINHEKSSARSMDRYSTANGLLFEKSIAVNSPNTGSKTGMIKRRSTVRFCGGTLFEDGWGDTKPLFMKNGEPVRPSETLPVSSVPVLFTSAGTKLFGFTSEGIFSDGGK